MERYAADLPVASLVAQRADLQVFLVAQQLAVLLQVSDGLCSQLVEQGESWAVNN